MILIIRLSEFHCCGLRLNLHSRRLKPSCYTGTDYTPYSKMAANRLFFWLHVN